MYEVMYEVIASEVHNEDTRSGRGGCFNDFSDTISGRMIGPLAPAPLGIEPSRDFL